MGADGYLYSSQAVRARAALLSLEKQWHIRLMRYNVDTHSPCNPLFGLAFKPETHQPLVGTDSEIASVLTIFRVFA